MCMFNTGLALITHNQALLWTDGRYFLQAAQQLSSRWKLMRIGEDPTVEAWIADVRHQTQYWVLFCVDSFLKVAMH